MVDLILSLKEDDWTKVRCLRKLDKNYVVLNAYRLLTKKKDGEMMLREE